MRALVTGSSRGIGRATALRLAQDGMSRDGAAAIMLTGRDRAALDEAAAEIAETGARVAIALGDMVSPEDPARIVAEASAFCGGLDTVVANAGITSPGSLAELSLEAWDRVFAINARAPWLLAKAAYGDLRRSRGSFIAVSSMSGLFPHLGHGVYAPTKAALIMLCQQLAQEWGPDGIRVNAVCPGMTRTPLTEPVYADPAIATRRAELVPLRRVGRPEDVAGAVAFLASDDARYVTGEALRVDGGFSSSILGHIPGLPRSG